MKFEVIFQCSILTQPKPKARPRFTRQGRCYTPKTTADYETLVRNTLHAAFSIPAIENRPLKLELTFYMERPKTVKREYPTAKPDIDNLMKAMMDAANKILYKDDALICDIVARKRYATSEPYIQLELSYLDSLVEYQEMPS